jgi:hypothetical protein
MGWMIGGFSPGRGWEFVSSPPRPDRLWGSPSLLSNGYQGLLSWGWSGRDEVKNAWNYISTPQYAFMAWCSVKAQGQLLTFTTSDTHTRGCIQSFRTGRLERELQTVQLSATRCSCIAILWVSLVSFAAITLCVASQQVFIVVVVHFVMTQSGNFWIHPLFDLNTINYGSF